VKERSLDKGEETSDVFVGVSRRAGRTIAEGLRVPVLFVAASLALSSASWAGQTGQIAGSVVDRASHQPVANARVTAVSPSGKYAATTDAHGAFAIPGVVLDTYRIEVEAPGYASLVLTGVTVTADETVRLNLELVRGVKTIATVRVRPIASAYQPQQTIGRYSLNAAAMAQLVGKTFQINAKDLLSKLPSVTVDKNGTALIRGGFSFQTGYEFEGIDYTEPTRNLGNRFENVATNDLLNGVGTLEIVPGGGDATHGDTGTGLIVATAKHGSYPAFGTLDLEGPVFGSGGPGGGFQAYFNGTHQVGFEYGVASRIDQHLSDYIGYVAAHRQNQYGPYGTPPAGLQADPTSVTPSSTIYAAGQRRIYTSAVFNPAGMWSEDLVDNLIQRFGRGQRNSLQFFLQAQRLHQELDYGGFQIFSAVPQTLFIPDYVNPATPSSFSQAATAGINSLSYLVGQNSAAYQAFVRQYLPRVSGAVPGQPLTAPESIDATFSALKLEYHRELSAAASLAVRTYQTRSDQQENLPSQGLEVPANGGLRRGLASDLTLVAGTRHTVQLGGKYDFVVPFGTQQNVIDYTGAYSGLYAFLGSNVINFGPYTHDIFADFVRPVSPVVQDAYGNFLSGTPGCAGVTDANGQPYKNPLGPPPEHCGYLWRYFASGPPPIPPETEGPTAKQQVYALYLQDTWAPSGRWRALIGVRLDGYNFLIPSDPQNPPAVDGIRHQRLYEPHLGLAYQMGSHDLVRLSFGRTLAIPLAGFLGNNIDRSIFAAFEHIPSFDSVTGKPAVYCGPGHPVTILGTTFFLGNQPCTSYADQLYWLMRNARFAAQSQIAYPLRGATFTNYDISYAHEFPSGVALKVTPFYRRGYDIVEDSRTLLGIDPLTGTQYLSPDVYSNLGIQKALGVELDVTTPPADTGWSGQLSTTYINQIGNDPPGDYLPTASVELGKLYHSPNLAPVQSSLALTYRPSRMPGWQFNPVLTLRSGYPYGAGILGAFTIAGQPYYIPYTNALFPGLYESILSNAGVNPQYPGTFTNPNLFATRGLESPTSGPGSLLSRPRLTTDLSVQFAPPRDPRWVFGIVVNNLFNNTASYPVPNYALNCQLVYTGLCASLGIPSVADPTHGLPVTAGDTRAPYIAFLNQPPISVRTYVQFHL
jgi:hypothetical protein